MKYVIALCIFLGGMTAGVQVTIWQLGRFIQEDRTSVKDAYHLVLESKQDRIEQLRLALGDRDAQRVVPKRRAR
jgi:hypothetical protein